MAGLAVFATVAVVSVFQNCAPLLLRAVLADLKSATARLTIPFRVAAKSGAQVGYFGTNYVSGKSIMADNDPAYFEWGMPLFIGRTIFFGLENQNSPLGAGPIFGVK